MSSPKYMYQPYATNKRNQQTQPTLTLYRVAQGNERASWAPYSVGARRRRLPTNHKQVDERRPPPSERGASWEHAKERWGRRDKCVGRKS